MVARFCLPLVSLWTALRSGWRSSPNAFSLGIDRSRPRTLQPRNDIYGLENDDKMQPCISWSTSRADPMSCTALEMRCDAEIDIQMQVGAAADDSPGRSPPSPHRKYSSDVASPPPTPPLAYNQTLQPQTAGGCPRGEERKRDGWWWEGARQHTGKYRTQERWGGHSGVCHEQVVVDARLGRPVHKNVLVPCAAFCNALNYFG